MRESGGAAMKAMAATTAMAAAQAAVDERGGPAGAAQARGHAEVHQVWPRDGAVRVVGDIVAGPGAPAGEWRLLFVLRDRVERELAYPAPLDGSRFDVSLPVEDLVPPSVPARWDIYLTAPTGSGRARLRAGRHLDDVKGKKNIMVYPSQKAVRGGRAVLVRPYYTIKDNLSVSCEPLPSRSPAGQAP
jgi:hypothetical protein